MAYHYLTLGKTKAQIRELDLILAGGPEASPADVAAANREAMAALGQIGSLPPRKRKAKS